jgi:hypothetical protein
VGSADHAGASDETAAMPASAATVGRIMGARLGGRRDAS